MNTKVFLFTCLLTYILLANAQLKLESKHKRIIGGKDALPGQFPYIVSIQALPNPGDEYSNAHGCGGAVLNEQWILTAAHCLNDNGIPRIVKAGKYNLSKEETEEQVAVVDKIFRHKLYEKLGTPYDIGLIKLQTPLKLNEHVANIALPEKDSEPNGQGTLAGWGYWTLKPGYPVASILQTLSLSIIDRKTCNELVKNLNPEYSVSQTNLCTIGPSDAEIGPCGGDSGSPLAVMNKRGKMEIAGVHSWAFEPCGRIGAPHGYVRVSSFVEWINETINENKF